MSLRSIDSTLEVGGYGAELHVNSTLQSLEEKLPPILCDKWADFSSRITGRLPNISDFNEWAKQETKTKFCVRTNLLTFPDGKPSAPKNNSGATKPYKSGGGPRVHSTSVTSSSCAVCPGNHLVPDCPQFKGLSADKRGETVKEKRLCLKCLNTGHIQKDCSRDEVCGVS